MPLQPRSPNGYPELMTGMKIPNVSKLIADCWLQAEEALQQVIESKYPDRDEESVTELFQGELRSKLESVSSNGAVEHAFHLDIQRAFPRTVRSDLSRISSGLIATVNFHSKTVEKKTGGDFGLVLIRPDVSEQQFGLAVDDDYQRGLLCQAKVQRRGTNKWGDLTAKQKQILPERLSYSALVLYQYSELVERRKLAPFQWQLTSSATIQDVSGWLKTGQFPGLKLSKEIIESIATDLIGTGNKKIIAEFITPPSRPSLEIRVGWRDGDGPGGFVRTHTSTAVQQHVMIRQ